MGFLRRLGERISRNVVLKRRLPERYGSRPLFVTPDSRLSYWRRDVSRVEPDLIAWSEELVSEGHTVWDIGANVGVFSLAAAVRAGPGGYVVALEPDLEMARLLRRSISLDPNRNEAAVTVLPLAAGDTNEIVELRIAARGRSSNYVKRFGGGSQAGGVREDCRILSVTLDWLAERVPLPDLIKIDVEGAEAAVLRGGRALLKSQLPVILIEVYERNREVVGRLLRGAGYRLYDATSGEPGDRRPVPTPVTETLCVPENSESAGSAHEEDAR